MHKCTKAKFIPILQLIVVNSWWYGNTCHFILAIKMIASWNISKSLKGQAYLVKSSLVGNFDLINGRIPHIPDQQCKKNTQSNQKTNKYTDPLHLYRYLL